MNDRDAQQVFALFQSVFGCVFAVGALAVLLYACFSLMNCLQRIPAPFRKMEPGMVWLMLVPCFNIVWAFFVYPRVANSFKAYFDHVHDDSVGDCGAGLGLATAICHIVCGPVGLILLIVYVIKANGLKNKIPEDADQRSYDEPPPAAGAQ